MCFNKQFYLFVQDTPTSMEAPFMVPLGEVITPRLFMGLCSPHADIIDKVSLDVFNYQWHLS